MSQHRKIATPGGSKASWAHVTALLGGFVAISAAALLLAAALPAGLAEGAGLGVRTGAGLVLILFIYWVVSWRVARRDWNAALGLGAPRRGCIQLVAVAGGSAVIIATVYGAAFITDSAVFEEAPVAQTVLTVMITVPGLLIATVIPEELVFRGYLQHWLGRRYAPMPTIGLQAAMYAAVMSLFSLSTSGIFMAFLTGVGLGYLRFVSRNLWGVLGLRLTMTTTAVIAATLSVEFSSAAALWNLGLGWGCLLPPSS